MSCVGLPEHPNPHDADRRSRELNPFLYRGYCYDREAGYYYLRTRYYDPEACRFLSPDDPSLLLLTADHANGIMSYTYCADNPVMDVDDDGQMPKWRKWLLGGALFVAAVALTAMTGGALAPVIGGMAFSVVSGGLIQEGMTVFNGGDFWDGFWDGAADGALWGGALAFGGAALRTIKIFKNGVVIGESMSRVNQAARVTGSNI